MKFTVFGNPIAHSLSPIIHQQFAKQLRIELEYTRSLASKLGFAEAVAKFFRTGGAGANVTVPFKATAAKLVTHLTPRAARAGAVNTLIPLGRGQLAGDTTDGEGLVRDLQRLLKSADVCCEVLIIGAGGAASSVIEPLQQVGATIVMANRSSAKVTALQQDFGDLQAMSFAELSAPPPTGSNSRPRIIINATSASLTGTELPIHPNWFADSALAYDMMYGRVPTPFLRQAQQAGVEQSADGLGMLVEQAALAFALWHDGQLPNTEVVLPTIRAALEPR
ncbi:shikimate dehydrogenase [Pseudidiomarina homiensis]|uniref:Shikimate dehydrogenase (NADP(+)) n=1 Tax=Pseudidiomarina homiensis TaxID=364198 RepID=A0A432Y6V6_9GAMM|nr:shikimate dehydrogenase [Pseudidiomarina homiensis]RUO56718.1 shikimate dehydrogenase [Pseudidiomarina homiensis]